MTTVPAQTPPLRHLHIIHAAPTDNLTAAQQNEARDTWVRLGSYLKTVPAALYIEAARDMEAALRAGGAA